MAKPFDATLNDLIDLRPNEWAWCFGGLVGIPAGPVESVDTDLSTTLQGDRVFRVNGSRPALLHLEFQSSGRLGRVPRWMSYNTLLFDAHRLPVETVVVQLRREASASDQTGVFVAPGVSRPVHLFHYQVERVWERPQEFWTGAGVSLAPLGLLTDEAARDRPRALERFHWRVRDAAAADLEVKSLLGSSCVLCGLRYDRSHVAETYRRLAVLLEDSDTYQEILEKGRRLGGLEAKHDVLLQLGAMRFGPPSPTQAAALQAVDDEAKLRRLTQRVLEAASWDELLRDP